MQPDDKALLDANVRKVVGIAVLRRLRRLVDETQEEDRHAAAFTRYLVIAAAAGALALALVCWLSPESIIGALRSVAGHVR